MQQYAIEKTRARVTFRLRGGFERQALVFLPVLPEDQPTVNKIRALLSQPEPFLPIGTDDGQTVVQNKDHILWCRYEGPPGPVVEVLCERRRMTLMLTDGTTLAGDVVADGPPDERRVLDCLNRAGGYLLVEAQDADYVVRRDAIDVVPSAELGEPREFALGGFEVESPEPALVG